MRQTEPLSRLDRALASIDRLNADDPTQESVDGQSIPREVLYSQRMTRCLLRLEPQASEALQLAARAQHVRRWTGPRQDFPMTRAGYHQWRTSLQTFHADLAAQVMRESGYDASMIERVRSLIRKQNLKSDAEAQTLEDVICLVFLEFYFADFARGHDAAKVVAIVARTWKKMSARGHEEALKIPMPEDARGLVARALADQ